MKVKYYDRLTKDLFYQYGHRKEYNLLSLFYDVENKSFFPVPQNVEHADIISEILKIEKEDLKFYERPKKFIPVHIKFDVDFNVVKIIIGLSGLEMGYKVMHSKRDLTMAKRMAIKFINHGDFPIKKPLSVEVVKKFME